MIDSTSDGSEAKVSGGKSRWMERGILGVMCALVIGIYGYAARSGPIESWSTTAADTYYNLLVQGFRAGQLSIKREAPPGLAQLADPYNPAANAPYLSGSYNQFDLSYYKGKLYLYFGVTPALILFWPYAALTGHYLFHRQAVAIFCAVGFLAGTGLLRALWRRYFAEVNIGVVTACVLALGAAAGTPVLLPRSDVYEVAISCGYMLTMMTLVALWCALHEPEPRKRSGWLAMASVAYGLAVGARPSLLLGAVILLLPVAQAWRERQPVGVLLFAAAGPILLIGLGLMLYNALRFDNPFEFGMSYQLAPERQDTGQRFGWRYLWFNLRVYFLEPVRWSSRFPFVREIVVPPLPSGHHGDVEKPFGVLTNLPLVWLALAVPLAWRGRAAQARSILQEFLAAVGWLAGICTLTVGLFYATSMRYEVDFLPWLVLLAVIGILGLERALADRPIRRQAIRWGWGILLGFSVAFNLLSGVVNYAQSYCSMGNVLVQAGRVQEAMGRYEQALRIMPDLTEAHNSLGSTLVQVGRLQEAVEHYEQALRIKPDFAEAHNNLGTSLYDLGKVTEAIDHYELALRVKPDLAEAHNNLGVALVRTGRIQEAVAHYEQTLRIKPDFAEAHHNLGDALQQLNRVTEAIGHYEEALRIKPDFAEAHNNLGIALERMGKGQEAIGHFEQALRVKPDYAEAHYNLGVVLERAGRVQEAIGHYEQALQLKPDYPGPKNRLAQLRTGR